MTLEAIAGHDPNDPYTWNTPVPNYQANLSEDIRGLKVGVVKERVYSDVVDGEVGESVIRAIARLGELGADIEEMSLPLMVHSAAISSLVIMVDAASLHRDGLAQNLDEYDYNNRIRLLAGSIVPAQAYQRALKARQALRQEILDALNRVDVLVMPTSSIPASLIPANAGISSKQEVLDGYAGRRSFTSPFNLASVPALSVPCGFTSSNLPIGLQIAGRPFDEQTVFNVAYAYEQANDWYERHPEI